VCSEAALCVAEQEWMGERWLVVVCVGVLFIDSFPLTPFSLFLLFLFLLLFYVCLRLLYQGAITAYQDGMNLITKCMCVGQYM
jgi:hypothetical protein